MKLNFHRSYIDTDWGTHKFVFAGVGVLLMADIPGHRMMEKLHNYYPEIHDGVVDMLGIDLNCIINQLSDRQRRRVQILMGLIRPFKLILLYAITTSLDICVRQDLLCWLIKESNECGAAIIFTSRVKPSLLRTQCGLI